MTATLEFPRALVIDFLKARTVFRGCPPASHTPMSHVFEQTTGGQTPESFFYQQFRARELFDHIPAVLTRMDISGVPERRYVRNIRARRLGLDCYELMV